MFIDELSLKLQAGRGGDGVVRWLHEKGKDRGGPSGGNGGKGGDVYAVAVRDIGILSAYRNVKEFVAERGGDGSLNVRQGKVGDDILIKFPIGSRLTNLTTGYSVELLKDGEKVKLLQGGRGGLGNEHFKGSTNISPKQSTQGVEGEEAEFSIELLLVVDVGIIGLPNAGKSSLLNALTRARSKVGDFPFTTIEPALGDYYGLIIADIPGLIEGAAEGRGLGHKFLRHIERTKAILHCVSSESEDPVSEYKVVRNELELYNKDLHLSELDMTKKPEIVVLTKTDMVSREEAERKYNLLKKVNKNTYKVSILDDSLVHELGNFLTKTFKT